MNEITPKLILLSADETLLRYSKTIESANKKQIIFGNMFMTPRKVLLRSVYRAIIH